VTATALARPVSNFIGIGICRGALQFPTLLLIEETTTSDFRGNIEISVSNIIVRLHRCFVVEHLCHAVTSQARIQLGQSVVENQSALYRNGDSIFPLIKFPWKRPSGG
jgi:hypothetical protein